MIRASSSGAFAAQVSGDRRGQVREGNPKELLIPVELPEGKTVLTLEYQW